MVRWAPRASPPPSSWFAVAVRSGPSADHPAILNDSHTKERMTKKPTSKRETSVRSSAPATKGKPRSGHSEPAEPPARPPATTEGLDGAMRALALALDKK